MALSVTGVSTDMIRDGIVGIPALGGVLSQTGMRIVSDEAIFSNIRAAEATVGTALGVLLGVHTVYCQNAPAPEDYPDFTLYKPAIDKPRNWFEQDRWGAIPLPILPVREVLEVKVFPSGWVNASFTIPTERLRVDRKGFQIASAAMMVGGLAGWWWAGQTDMKAAPFSLMMMSDGRAMPGGIEVTYKAGLSKREIDDYPLIATLVKLEALVLTLTFFQAFLGGGAQKESASMDGMANTVELRRSILGPLGGEIKALKASYNELLNIARMRFGGNLNTVWV